MFRGIRVRSARRHFASFRSLSQLVCLLGLLNVAVICQAESDLVAENIHVKPVTIDVDSTFALSLRIRNIGSTTAAIQTTKVFLSPDSQITGDGNDIPLVVQEVPSLATGKYKDYPTTTSRSSREAYTLVAAAVGLNKVQLTAGVYFIGAIVDVYDQVPNETNEKNTFLSSDRLRILIEQPGVPTDPIPSAGMNNVSTTRDLQWAKTPHAARYDLYLARVKDMDQITSAHDLDAKFPLCQNVAVTDLDLNGSPDVIAVGGDMMNWQIVWYPNKGDYLSAPPPAPSIISSIDDDLTSQALIANYPTSVIAVNLNRWDTIVEKKYYNYKNPIPSFDSDKDVVVASYSNMDPTKVVGTGRLIWYETVIGKTISFTPHEVPQWIPVKEGNETVQKQIVWPYGTRGVAAADFDNDGDLDLVQASDEVNWPVDAPTDKGDILVMYFSDLANRPDTAPDAKNPVPDFPQWTPWAVTVRDKDESGNYIASSPETNVKYRIRDAHDIKVCDVDRDGWMDIVMVSQQGDAVYWLKNENGPGSATFSAPFKPFTVHLLKSLKGPTSVRCYDIDGDQDPDIFVNSYFDKTLYFMRNDGPFYNPSLKYSLRQPNFSSHLMSNQLDEIDDIKVGDMNCDNRMDVVATSAVQDQVVVFLNDGKTTPSLTGFVRKEFTSLVDRVQAIAIADIDMDQFPDIVGASYFKGAVKWFKNIPLIKPEHRVGVSLAWDPSRENVVYTPPAGTKFDYSTTYAWQVTATVAPPGGQQDEFNTSKSPLWSFKTQPTSIDANLTVEPAVTETDGFLNVNTNATPTGPVAPEEISYSIYAMPNDPVNNKDDYFTWSQVANQTPMGVIRYPETSMKIDLKSAPLAEGEYYLAVVAQGAVLGIEDGGWDGVIDGMPDTRYIDSAVGPVISPYYIFLRSFTNNTFGDDVFYANLKVCNVPDKPFNPNPPDKATNVDAGMTLRWTKTDHTTAYSVSMAKASESQASITTGTVTSGFPVSSVSAVDLNKDGYVDVIGAIGGSQGQVAWYKNNGALIPTFSSNVVSSRLASPNFVSVADLNGDANPDILAASNSENKIMWFRNNGQTAPTFTAGTVTTLATGVNSVQAADLDGDGDQDVISASFYGNRLAWYENDGTAKFTARTIDATNGLAAYAVAADMDGDGDQDIVAAFWDPSTIAWYENKGGKPLKFVRHVVTTTTAIEEPSCVAVADIDGDGRPDIVSASQQVAKVAWYKNSGATVPTFATKVLIQAPDRTADGVRSVIATDFNHDGYMDIIAGAANSSSVIWFKSNGATSPTFTTNVLTSDIKQVSSVFAADVNSDGLDEVLCASPADNAITWLSYSINYDFNNELKVVAANQLNPLYRPSKPLASRAGYQWQATSRNTINLLALTDDDRPTTFSRETAGDLWSFFTGQPDLVAENITINPATLQTDDTSTISCQIANIGDSTALGHWEEVWASPDAEINRSGNDIILGKQWVNILGPGKAVAVAIPFRDDQGRHVREGLAGPGPLLCRRIGGSLSTRT